MLSFKSSKHSEQECQHRNFTRSAEQVLQLVVQIYKAYFVLQYLPYSAQILRRYLTRKSSFVIYQLVTRCHPHSIQM